jgi:hypothetical protein
LGGATIGKAIFLCVYIEKNLLQNQQANFNKTYFACVYEQNISQYDSGERCGPWVSCLIYFLLFFLDDPPNIDKVDVGLEPSKKNGTSCVVATTKHGKSKVMAPRGEEYPKKLPEKDLPKTSDLAEDLQLTTNATVDLLDQLVTEVEFRTAGSKTIWDEQFQGPLNRSLPLDNHSPGTQTFPSTGQTFDEKQSIPYNLDSSLTDSLCNVQAVDSQTEDAGKVWQGDTAGIDVDTELSEYLMGFSDGPDPGQEVTCGDLILNLPQDACVLK